MLYKQVDRQEFHFISFHITNYVGELRFTTGVCVDSGKSQLVANFGKQISFATVAAVGTSALISWIIWHCQNIRIRFFGSAAVGELWHSTNWTR